MTKNETELNKKAIQKLDKERKTDILEIKSDKTAYME